MKKKDFDGYRKMGPDAEIESRIEAHCREFKLSHLDAIKLFPVLARRQWLKRFLAHVELFKKTLDVPGDIVELGVFRGAGLMTWANLLEAYCVGDRTKIVYGFDNWKGFVALASEDGKEVGDLQKAAGGFSPEQYLEELKNAVAIFDNDRFVPWKDRIQLIVGNIEETIPALVKDNPGIRLSLIHFDCDLYRPTKAALECLWPILSRGGALLFDEYSIHDWPGETAAVDGFFKDKPEIRVKTLPWTNTPAGYVIKE